jgi:hypothetical protein
MSAIDHDNINPKENKISSVDNKSNRIFEIIKANMISVCLSLPLMWIISYVQMNIFIPFKFYNLIYSLNNFSTFHLSLNKLITLVTFLILGFCFVNIVNLNNKRQNPLIGNNGYKDIKRVLLFSVIIFFGSGNFLLLGKYDFEGFCDKNISNNGLSNTFAEKDLYFNTLIQKNELVVSNEHTYEISIGLYSFAEKLSKYFNSNLYFKNFIQECNYPVLWETILNNYFFFILPFILGLNFTYLDYIKELQLFTLSCDDMKKWGCHLWTLFFLLIAFLSTLLIILTKTLLENSIKRFLFYLLMIIFFVGICIYITKKTGKKFHLHHYALGLIVCCFLGIHNDLFTIVMGIFSGVMVEGSCRWGVSPLWDD